MHGFLSFVLRITRLGLYIFFVQDYSVLSAVLILLLPTVWIVDVPEILTQVPPNLNRVMLITVARTRLDA